MGIKKVSQMVKIFAKMKEGWITNKDACFMCNSASGDRRLRYLRERFYNSEMLREKYDWEEEWCETESGVRYKRYRLTLKMK